MDDNGIDGNNQIRFFAFGRDIDNDHPLMNPDLDRCEADTGSVIHGLGHVPDQVRDLFIDYGNRSRFLFQFRVRIGKYSSYHTVPCLLNLFPLYKFGQENANFSLPAGRGTCGRTISCPEFPVRIRQVS